MPFNPRYGQHQILKIKSPARSSGRAWFSSFNFPNNLICPGASIAPDDAALVHGFDGFVNVWYRLLTRWPSSSKSPFRGIRTVPLIRYEFDWDASKAEANIAKHGVAFELAMTVFMILWQCLASTMTIAMPNRAGSLSGKRGMRSF